MCISLSLDVSDQSREARLPSMLFCVFAGSVLAVSRTTGVLQLGFAGVVGVLRHVRMLIPRRVVGIVAVVDLNESHAGLREPPRKKTLAAVIVSVLFANPVERLHVIGLAFKVDYPRRRALHAPCEFITFDDGLERVVAGLVSHLSRIQRLQ